MKTSILSINIEKPSGNKVGRHRKTVPSGNKVKRKESRTRDKKKT